MDYKAEFLEIFNTYVTRKGADKMLEWLERTDFFTAPASTRYHGACESGLVMHSLNVYHLLKEKCEHGSRTHAAAERIFSIS